MAKRPGQYPISIVNVNAIPAKDLYESKFCNQEEFFQPPCQLYSAQEPTLAQKLGNWLRNLFAPKPSVTMQLTTSVKSKPTIPTSYRDYMRQFVPTWQQIKQWPSQAKERAKSTLEQKAEAYKKQKRYIPQGWVVDPWQ